MSVWNLGDYIFKNLSVKKRQQNMASDPERWEPFTITSAVWHLHTDWECKQQLKAFQLIRGDYHWHKVMIWQVSLSADSTSPMISNPHSFNAPTSSQSSSGSSRDRVITGNKTRGITATHKDIIQSRSNCSVTEVAMRYKGVWRRNEGLRLKCSFRRFVVRTGSSRILVELCDRSH